MPRIFSLVFFFFFLFSSYGQIPEGFFPGKPLADGHSHNDYLHRNPLFDALAQGFTSVEADIFLAADGTLRVSHVPFALRMKPILRDLYLEPLSRWIAQNGGHVFRDSAQVLTLMIDLKGDGNLTYPVLRQELERYPRLFTHYVNGAEIKGPVRVMLSGSKPWNLVKNEEIQWVCFDGSPNVDYTGSGVKISRLSSPYASWFRKRPCAKMTAEETDDLKLLVYRADFDGRELRFWGAGNNPRRWKKLREVGVTVINVDRLKRFRKFLESEPKR
jgi:glycerophosphoryl diester phosphodiesterase